VFALKKNISQILIPALRKNGCAFDLAKYINKRNLIINSLLDEDCEIGEAYSPYLKGNKKIKIVFFNSHLVLNDDLNNTLVRIDNYMDDVDNTVNIINEYYQAKFYEKDEIKEILKDRADVEKIEKLLDIFYPDVKVRNYGIVESNLYLYLGAGIFSFEIKTTDTNKRSCFTKIHFYGRSSGKYQTNNYGQIWNLNSKYRYLISFSQDQLEINDFNFHRYVKAYNKSKTI